MAGYLITISEIESLTCCFEEGIYSTRVNQPKNDKWLINHEGTFADYANMKAGDNIYFFNKRKIYGIGVLVKRGYDCKYVNFPEASKPSKYSYKEIRKELLIDFGEDSGNYRWICCFEPAPLFFKQGIDMDDVLASNPSKFKMVRALWKLSFIKLDDEENKALKDLILFRNRELLEKEVKQKDSCFSYKGRDNLAEVSKDYYLTPKDIISSCANGVRLTHEMAIEAGLVYELTENKKTVFGKWDYISHQVIASPFKPIDYMDKIDVFGYRYLDGYETVSDFLIAELKKDEANLETLNQIMKYVDWVCAEYALNDYSRIEAYIVAAEFSDEIIAKSKEICVRNFTVGVRPSIASRWSNINFIKYRYNDKTQALEFYSAI